jgi:hypothetical protein
MIKVLFQGASLKTKLATAIVAATIQTDQYKQSSTGFPSAKIEKWESMLLAWEVDNSKLDPYAVAASCAYSCSSDSVPP